MRLPYAVSQCLLTLKIIMQRLQELLAPFCLSLAQLHRVPREVMAGTRLAKVLPAMVQPRRRLRNLLVVF